MNLSQEEIYRYSRHLILPEVGLEGQEKLKASSILCIGAGGLGSPIGLYLAAAGVGHLGLVDFDVIDETNLQRQVAFTTADVGKSKVETAQKRLQALNPLIEVTAHQTRLSSENAMEILRPYDIVVDGTDNFATRYLVNDACALLGKPLVYGSIYQFEGQVSVFDANRGPCYRCLFPSPPPPGLVPSCAEGGVLGILPGVIGSLQATEAIKLILGKGQSLLGRLLLFNALDTTFRTLTIRKNPDCPLCGPHATLKTLIDYEEFCGVRGGPPVHVEDEVTVEELSALMKRGEPVQLVDIREPHETALCRIEPSRVVPMGAILENLHRLDTATEYIFYCRSGHRSRHVVDFLKEHGYQKVKHLKGGILEWAEKIDPSLPKY